jgi:CBS-domain-containing membrane protein
MDLILQIMDDEHHQIPMVQEQMDLVGVIQLDMIEIIVIILDILIKM